MTWRLFFIGVAGMVLAQLIADRIERRLTP